MIRLSTCVSVVLACGSGLYLYQTKHQAQVLDRQIEHTVKAINQTRMQTRELSASWTLLGSPDRLQQLSDQFLDIKPVLPSQFVAMSDLDLRLAAPRILDAPSSGDPSSTAPSSSVPDATGSATPGVATTEPTDAPDTPTTPAWVSPAPSIPIANSRAVAAATSPAPSSHADADAARAVTLAAAAVSQGPAADPAKAQIAATAHPSDRKPGETAHQVRDQGHDPGRDFTQVHPAAPHPANPSPVVAELERPGQPASQRFAPAPIAGSLLGMARVSVRAPVPLPVSTAPHVETGH